MKTQTTYNRKEFLSFLGKIGIGVAMVPPFLASCGNTTTPNSKNKLSEADKSRLKDLVLQNLAPSNKDDLLLSKGLSYQPIIRWNEAISDQDLFGFNNDFTCFIPLDKTNPNDGLLWVNHEYINPLFVSNFNYRDYDNPREHRTQETSRSRNVSCRGNYCTN